MCRSRGVAFYRHPESIIYFLKMDFDEISFQNLTCRILKRIVNSPK